MRGITIFFMFDNTFSITVLLRNKRLMSLIVVINSIELYSLQLLYNCLDKFHGLTPGLKSNLSPKNNVLLVNEGQPLAIYCSFDGEPRPVLEWYQSSTALETSISRLTRLMSSDNYRTTPNMLLIASASHKESTKFICVANNTRAEQRYETQVFVRSESTL